MLSDLPHSVFVIFSALTEIVEIEQKLFYIRKCYDYVLPFSCEVMAGQGPSTV